MASLSCMLRLLNITPQFRFCCAAVLLALPFQTKGQAPIAANNHFTCSYYGEDIDPEIKMYAAGPDAKKVISQILGVVGLKPNFEIRAANVPNAAAVILNSKRYILYNRRFIAEINSASGNDWAGISILAHEIGHHLNGHTLTGGGRRPDLELEADEFSGFVLSRLGATLSDAQAAMQIAASLKASHTHPAKQERLYAIAAGWKNGGGQNSARPQARKSGVAVERPVMVEIPEREATIAEKSIAFDVHFTADAEGQYFITTKGQLVSADDDSISVIGHLGESDRPGYRLMLSDKNYNYLYVAPKGIIVNGAGKNVGYINPH